MRSLVVGSIALTGASPVAAQAGRYYEQAYLRAPHNGAFRDRFPTADRLFNAFDYGHAILYETLRRRPDAPAAALDGAPYEFITTRLLAAPPRVPLDEAAIGPRWARLAPEALAMFEWAHLLHRQLYDVLADERVPDAERDARVAEVVRYYRSRPALAFSSSPKSMALMEGQPYSLAFRRRFPRFNGLIWSYHWLQMALYDALLAARTPAERQALAAATVTRFWELLGDAPSTTPALMPMSAAIAPRFAERYPEAAIIFDNLHSLHDVIADILASDSIPSGQKRAAILAAAARYRDATSSVTTVAEWRAMAAEMGAERMGGLPPVAADSARAPAVPRGHEGHGRPPSPAARPR